MKIETRSSTENPAVSSREALADAMVWAYTQHFKKAIISGLPDDLLSLPALKKTADPAEHIKLLTQAITVEKCERNSAYVLFYLHQHHPHLFDRYALLESIGGSGHPRFRNPAWLCHYCFLVRDLDGTHHAGSPANYNPSPKPGRKNSLTRIISSKHLDKVIKRISLFEGGSWPDQSMVENALLFTPPTTVTNHAYLTHYQSITLPVIGRQGGLDHYRHEPHHVPICPNGELITLKV